MKKLAFVVVVAACFCWALGEAGVWGRAQDRTAAACGEWLVGSGPPQAPPYQFSVTAAELMGEVQWGNYCKTKIPGNAPNPQPGGAALRGAAVRCLKLK